MYFALQIKRKRVKNVELWQCKIIDITQKIQYNKFIAYVKKGAYKTEKTRRSQASGFFLSTISL